MSKDNKEQEINLKILLLGDRSAGKTALLLKYIDDINYFPYIETIGVEIIDKKTNINGIDLNLKIYDTLNQERFRQFPKSFFRLAHGIMLIYDITNRSTFENMENFLRDTEEYEGNVKKIIVGNNCESENNRQVSKETLQNLCQKKNIQGMEVSAKNGTNVNECFELLAKLIIEGKTKEEIIEKYGEAKHLTEIDDENLKEKFIHKNLEKYLNY